MFRLSTLRRFLKFSVALLNKEGDSTFCHCIFLAQRGPLLQPRALIPFCHIPIPQTGEEDATNTMNQLDKPPMNIIKRNQCWNLKLTSIHRCGMNLHSAEATHIHFQHKHVHHNYSIDIKYIIAEMKYRQQTYLLVKNSSVTSYVATTFHPTIGQRAPQSLNTLPPSSWA